MIILYIKCVSFHHSLWIVRTATLPDKWVTNTLTNPHSKGRVHFFFWRLFYVVSTTLYRSVSSHVKDLLAIQLYSYIIPCIQGIIHSYNFCPYLVQSQWICVKYWSVKLLWNIFCTCSIIDSHDNMCKDRHVNSILKKTHSLFKVHMSLESMQILIGSWTCNDSKQQTKLS